MPARIQTALKAGTALSIGLVLAGCALTPDLGAPPQVAAPAHYAAGQSFAGSTAAWPADRWWTSYGDAALSALIDEALADSPTLAAAAARVRAAEAAAQQTGAAALPTVTAHNGLAGTYQHISGADLPPTLAGAINSGWRLQTNAQTRIDYQVDFFGKNRAAIAAARSRAEAAGAEAAAARLQLSTAVAATYAEFARLGAERATLIQSARVRKDSADLVRERLTRGLENEGQASQADSELARAQADVVAVEGAILRTRHALAALLGKGPDRGLAIGVPQSGSVAARGVPPSAGLELMGRRPDLVAARLRAEAAAERIKVAKADFYPNVTLSAVAGLQTLGITSLGGGTLTSAQVGPAVSLPIFSAGAIEGAYRGARADYDAAVASYDQAVADAFREVADVLSDRRTLDAQLVQSRAALTASENAYRVARQRYESGLASYIEILTIENALVRARHTVTDLEARAFGLDVATVRALGGGFIAS